MYSKSRQSLVADEDVFADACFNSDQEVDSDLLLKDNRTQVRQGRMKCHLIWIAHGISIFVCLSLFILAHSVYNESRRSCIEKFNAYSPLLEAIDEDYQEVRFKYSLWYKSPYKGPPTPQVHQSWHDLMQYGTISVTADDILRIGHNITAVQFPASVGGGYPATAMGTHAIHCLHYIWQDHYLEVSPEVQATKDSIPEMYERHYEHCIDYIRQYLMCKFDTTVMPFNWVRDHQNPTPNGNTIHKCVKWDSLQDWLKRRAVEMPEGFKWHQPPDAVRLDWNP